MAARPFSSLGHMDRIRSAPTAFAFKPVLSLASALQMLEVLWLHVHMNANFISRMVLRKVNVTDCGTFKMQASLNHNFGHEQHRRLSFILSQPEWA